MRETLLSLFSKLAHLCNIVKAVVLYDLKSEGVFPIHYDHSSGRAEIMFYLYLYSPLFYLFILVCVGGGVLRERYVIDWNKNVTREVRHWLKQKFWMLCDLKLNIAVYSRCHFEPAICDIIICMWNFVIIVCVLFTYLEATNSLFLNWHSHSTTVLPNR